MENANDAVVQNIKPQKKKIPLWAMLVTHLLPTLVGALAVACFVLVNITGRANDAYLPYKVMFVCIYGYSPVGFVSGVAALVLDIINLRTDKTAESIVLFFANVIRLICVTIVLISMSKVIMTLIGF